MSDRKPMPAAGGDDMKDAPDGVNTDPSGQSEQGESGGGSYPNCREDADDRSGGFPKHGGQSNIGYHGGGQAGQDGSANPNSAAHGDDDFSDQGEAGPKPGPRGPAQDDDGSRVRTEVMQDRTVKVEEASGIAAAEASGLTGADGQNASDEEAPGSGQAST